MPEKRVKRAITALREDPIIRECDGGRFGPLILELRKDTVTLRPKNKWRSSPVTVTDSWARIYLMALATQENAEDIIQPRHRRRQVARTAATVERAVRERIGKEQPVHD